MYLRSGASQQLLWAFLWKSTQLPIGLWACSSLLYFSHEDGIQVKRFVLTVRLAITVNDNFIVIWVFHLWTTGTSPRGIIALCLCSFLPEVIGSITTLPCLCYIAAHQNWCSTNFFSKHLQCFVPYLFLKARCLNINGYFQNIVNLPKGIWN